MAEQRLPEIKARWVGDDQEERVYGEAAYEYGIDAAKVHSRYLDTDGQRWIHYLYKVAANMAEEWG